MRHDVAQPELGVCAILLGSDADVLVHDLQDRFPAAQLLGGDEDFDRLVATVIGFVENPTRGLGLPLDVRGIRSGDRHTLGVIFHDAK